ncbi:MAG TPA: winged helix-turn-helix domain-containing protein [Trebonia sp.]|nr:winged helix-turn-helix domain-containing protein [Trebonia sp.]
MEADDPRTPSVQIADDLRSQIERGELTQGQKLPSGRELAAGYGVALMTAQAAVQRLRDERLVYSTPRGYFVGAAEESSSPIGGPEFAKRLDAVEREVRELRVRLDSIDSNR